MNDAARDVLVAAAVRGHAQAHCLHHPAREAECAMGVLHLTMHEDRAAALRCVEDPAFAYSRHCYDAMTDRYGISFVEARAIQHANDVDQWDFLTIARKVGLA